MNIVERIQQLQNNVIVVDENYAKLKDALEEYHCLIQERMLSPKCNSVQNIYTVFSFTSNIDM